MRLDANATWFNFNCQGTEFAVYSFTGKEELCNPYEFRIELVSRSSNVDIASFLGAPACLSIADKSGEKRLVHGIIREMEQLQTTNAFTRYACVLSPRIRFLDMIRDHRIFQNMKPTDIIGKILKEQGFSGESFSFKAGQKFPEYEYAVQYGESALYFIQRLCENESIFFYHTHKEDGHALVFYDYKGGPQIPGESNIQFHPGSGQPAETSTISGVRLRHKINSNAAAYKEWNFKNPRLVLEVSDSESDGRKAPTPPGMALEQYRYPHIYDMQESGKRYVRMQLERQLTFSRWIEAESDVSRFLPGHVFSIDRHPRDDVNTEWFITAVEHEGEQPGVLEHEAPSGRGLRYVSRVTAIPKDTRYVPQLEHPKNRIVGNQTAIVTGPKGEEIYPDAYGRVKVQFFWDREGKWDDKTTCWIRVSQGWAGGRHGAVAIPRVGHEVIVSFLEGDPERPLVTGRVHHELNKTPYELPANKTRTVFKSMSTPGEEGKPRGFNELRIEDKKGEEEIYVHAEKDMNTYTKNDWKDHIAHDRHQIVEHFTYLETKGETHETLRDQRKTEIFANDNRTVHADSHLGVDGKWLVKAGEEVHIKSGMKVVIEAGTELTIKAGGQWVKLDPAGLKTSAMVMIGQGPAGTGTGANPKTPEKSLAVEEGQGHEGSPDSRPAEKNAASSPEKKAAEGEGQAPKCQADALRAAVGMPFCAVCE